MNLEQYIKKTESINEGAIWNTIKDWFKKLFKDDSTDKVWNRLYDYDDYYDDAFIGVKAKKYQEYLKKNFQKNKTNLKIGPITKDDFKRLMKNIPYNEEDNTGFWKFDDYINDGIEKHTYLFVITYKDSKTTDVPCLLSLKTRNTDWIVIKKLQILNEFQKLLSLKEVIDIIVNEINHHMGATSKENEFNKIMAYENDDEELYNKLINDCKFEKKFDNKIDSNIAEHKITYNKLSE